MIVGRDPRASGVMMREGVMAGLMACGHDVIDLGVVSTPVIQHAIRRQDAAGGVSIGASHNAAEWNALKFFGPTGTYLSTGEAGELLDIYHLKKFDFVEWDRLGKCVAETGRSTRTWTTSRASSTSRPWNGSAWWWIAATAPRR